VEIVFSANRLRMQKQVHEAMLHEELAEEMSAFWREHRKVRLRVQLQTLLIPPKKKEEKRNKKCQEKRAWPLNCRIMEGNSIQQSLALFIALAILVKPN
jgi:hypothetical protein